MPSSLQESEQAEERLALGLAMIAGYVDAYGFISYRTYVSFMSGNTTQTGFLIGQGNLAVAVPALLAIVSFLVGVFTGTFLRHAGLLAAVWMGRNPAGSERGGLRR